MNQTETGVTLPGFMEVGAAAKHVGLSPNYLNQMRFYKKGPEFTKDRGRVFYVVADLDAWNATRTARNAKRKSNAASRKKPAPLPAKGKTPAPKGKTAKR